MGLSERAGDRVEALSLGNQQRVQLAAALVHDPVLLVLDEPFSGLDPVGVDVLAGVLQDKAAAGTPVVFSSHQLELVERLCEAVAIINKGRLVASGSVAELRSAGRRRHWEVGVAGADPGWAADLPGARVLDHAGRNGRVLLELDDGTDEQAILDAARAAGRVTHFSSSQPTLTDLFRQAVQV
jgi:ABC-2 type transport system ATP-binding protein